MGRSGSGKSHVRLASFFSFLFLSKLLFTISYAQFVDLCTGREPRGSASLEPHAKHIEVIKFKVEHEDRGVVLVEIPEVTHGEGTSGLILIKDIDRWIKRL